MESSLFRISLGVVVYPGSVTVPVRTRPAAAVTASMNAPAAPGTAGAASTITLDQAGGSGGTERVTAVFGFNLPSITPPGPREGYTFAGYYDTPMTGTIPGWKATGTLPVQYYKADGTSAHGWDRSDDVTLYAWWDVWWKAPARQTDTETQ